MFDGITSCRDLLDKFGGHSHAAGLSIQRGRIDEFRRRLNEHAASCLTEDDLLPAIAIDAEIGAKQLGFKLSQDLRALEPFGAGNPRPVFMTQNLRCLSPPSVIKERHLKFRVAGPQNRPLEAVWWNCIETPGQTPELNGSIELVYTLETSAWNGDYRMQLSVLDLKCRN